MIALCEVVETASLRKNGHIWVATDEDTVVTRFFFCITHDAGEEAISSARGGYGGWPTRYPSDAIQNRQDVVDDRFVKEVQDVMQSLRHL